jgi:hypothetical protein
LYDIEAKEKKTFLAKYGLNNYFLAAPIAAAVFVPLLEKGVSGLTLYLQQQLIY